MAEHYLTRIKSQERGGRMLYLLLSILLILISAFCISGTVFSQNATRMEEKYYREMESVYRQELRTLLTDRGFEDCGITMTHVVDENGERSYDVTIHHRKISRLSESEKSELRRACEEIPFPDAACKFYHNFLEEDL